jgi:hypothetical protein
MMWLFSPEPVVGYLGVRVKRQVFQARGMKRQVFRTMRKFIHVREFSRKKK